jgi:hypothetical protein
MMVSREGPEPRASDFALAPSLVAALDDQVHRLTCMSDKAHVVRATSHILKAMRNELRRLSKLRLLALAELRASGDSYDRIAASTGLSKARVAQLSRYRPGHDADA